MRGFGTKCRFGFSKASFYLESGSSLLFFCYGSTTRGGLPEALRTKKSATNEKKICLCFIDSWQRSSHAEPAAVVPA